MAILDISRREDSMMAGVLGEEKMIDLVSEFWPVQPEPGSVADQLIKKGEAIGIAIGEARGEARKDSSRKIDRLHRMPHSNRMDLPVVIGRTGGISEGCR